MKIHAAFLIVAALASAPAFAQSLSLEEALRSGEAQSPRLAAQRHALDAAGELIGRAAELPDPTLRLGLENLPLNGPLRYRTDRDFMTMRSIGVMQAFPNESKRAARGARSEKLRDLEQASLAEQRADLRGNIARAWLDLHFAERARSALEVLVARIEAQAEAVAAGVARGRQGAAESFMLRGAAELARDRVIEQERVVARGRIALAVWIGADAERALGAAPDVSRLAIPVETLLARLHRHPQLAVIDGREKLARAEIDLARSTKHSDWSLQVGYAHRGPDFSNMLSVMVAMDLPWQAERRQDRDIAARAAELERVRALREDARRLREAEIRAWHADHASAARRIERFQRVLLPLARERVEAATAAYRGARGDLGAVLDAHRALAEVEIGQIGEEAKLAQAWARLAYVYAPEAAK